MQKRTKVSDPRFWLICLILLFFSVRGFAAYLLIPMDDSSQKNHLKAYGITFYSLLKGKKVQWLLNYRGGSFLLEDNEDFRNECVIRGVSYEAVSESQALDILAFISSPSQNMESVILEKAPKIAVYSPKDKQPWDDAVTMVLQYAEIPYDGRSRKTDRGAETAPRHRAQAHGGGGNQASDRTQSGQRGP